MPAPAAVRNDSFSSRRTAVLTTAGATIQTGAMLSAAYMSSTALPFRMPVAANQIAALRVTVGFPDCRHHCGKEEPYCGKQHCPPEIECRDVESKRCGDNEKHSCGRNADGGARTGIECAQADASGHKGYTETDRTQY